MMKMVLALALLVAVAHAGCPNACSGHGKCKPYDVCVCDDEDRSSYFGYLYDTTKGYDRIADAAGSVKGQIFAQLRSTVLASTINDGSASVAGAAMSDTDAGTQARRRSLAKTAFTQKAWLGSDCSKRACPRGVSWVDAHPEDMNLHKDFVVCSGIGECNEGSGECTCPEGYEGKACQRTTCSNACSGHGLCRSNIEFAKDAETTVRKDYILAWDSGSHFGCKCTTGYRGEDCSEKECPSGTDPNLGKGNDEGRDCSGRGLCDYGSGECQCFPGYTGMDCSSQTTIA